MAIYREYKIKEKKYDAVKKNLFFFWVWNVSIILPNISREFLSYHIPITSSFPCESSYPTSFHARHTYVPSSSFLTGRKFNVPPIWSITRRSPSLATFTSALPPCNVRGELVTLEFTTLEFGCRVINIQIVHMPYQVDHINCFYLSWNIQA